MGTFYNPQIITSGLILYLDTANTTSYPGTGTTWSDLSPIRNNGTLTASPTFTTAGAGSYFTLNGSSQYWSSTSSTAFDTQSITLESWVYPTALSQTGCLFEKGAANTQYSHFFDNNGLFYFRTKSLSTEDLTFTTANFCTVNAWNQIVSTYSGGTKNIYVNGNLAATAGSLTGTIPTGQTGQFVGVRGPGSTYFFNGRISMTRIYNIALTADQVAQNFNAMRGRYGI